jgi:hypothetical protein
MKISIAIIMMPSIATEICHFSGETPVETSMNFNESRRCRFPEEDRTVIIGNESLQLGMLLTAVDSKRNCACSAGTHRNLGATSKFWTPEG